MEKFLTFFETFLGKETKTSKGEAGGFLLFTMVTASMPDESRVACAKQVVSWGADVDYRHLDLSDYVHETSG